LTGIAFLSRYGLHEVAGDEYASGDLFITLLRAFRRTVMINGETDGQLPGRLEYEYAYSIFPADTDYADLYRQWLEQRKISPSYLIKTESIITKHDQSVIELEGDLSFTTFKPGQTDSTATILRVVNLHDQPAQGRLRLSKPAATISQCALNEKVKCVLAQNARTIELNVLPWQIVTLKIN